MGVLVTSIGVCFLLLQIVEALYGRFYAWPCLTCWVLGRFLEVVFLALILNAARSRPRAAIPGSGGDSFGIEDGPDSPFNRWSLQSLGSWYPTLGQRHVSMSHIVSHNSGSFGNRPTTSSGSTTSETGTSMQIA